MPSPAFLYDDAYVTLASALALRAGSDPYFAGTVPLYGVTSPFHCLVVAALLLALPPLWALMASSLLGTACYGVALWRLGAGEGASGVERAALVGAGLGAGMVSQHQVNGLETSWAMACVAWMLWAVRAGRTRTLGALAGTAPFVRPELAIIALGLLALAWRRHPAERNALIGTGAVAAAPWLALLVWQIGSPVPTTLAAKRDWYAEGCWSIARRATVVASGLGAWLWAMPALAIGAAGLTRTTVGRLMLAASATILIVWASSVPNVLHAYQRHRYYAVFLPLLAYGLLTLPRWGRSPALYAAAAAGIVSTVAVVRLEPEAIARAMALRTSVNQALAREGAQRVLLHDAGYLAFTRAGSEGIDMVGLKTPRAAALHATHTRASCGRRRGEALAILAAETNPTHLVIWEPWDAYFGVTSALRDAGWTMTAVHTAVNKEPVHVYALARGERWQQAPSR